MHKVRLFGLKGAGKTTILTALWQLLTSHSEGQEFSLPPENYPPESTEWIALSQRWLQCEEIDRTRPEEVPNELDIVIRSSHSNRDVRVIVPDVAGEAYQLTYERDALETHVYKCLADANHVILVVSLRDFSPPVFLPHRNDAPPPTGDTTLQHWSPKEMREDAKNVALLIRLKEIFSGDPRIRLTIAIAAWDLDDIRRGRTKPTEVLQQCFPLLHQYATNNFENVEVVGISAQGWDYTDPPDAPELDPAKRVLYVTDDGSSNDLTRVFA